ncbi:MAG: hypothetical protein Q7U54_08030 [Bacteroidales bacterium]|nr:hypothetical protein [Bacteroidales bacterium]
MPELYNNLACLKPAELTSIGVISETALIKYTQRNKSIVARRGLGKGNYLLLYWDNLRPEIRDRYRRITKSNPADIIKSSAKLNLEPDYEAIDFFATKFFLPDGRHLKAEKQKQLVVNSQILNAIIKIKNERTLARKSRGISTRDMWADIIADVKSLKKELNHSLQCSPRLKEQVEEYVQNSYLSLISAKFMNSNAAKVTETDQEAALKQLLRNHGNLDNEQIRSLYNIVADSLGWKGITAATVANYRVKWDLITHSARHGVTSFDNKKAMQVKRSAPTNPMYYWTMDGWDVELLYQKTEIDEKGNTRTTFHNRLTAVIVLDPYCKHPIGFAIGTHETPQLIKDAIRNAITYTKELFGDYYKVLQLQTDNYSRKSLTSIYEVVSEKYTPARAHNAKSKVIEPYFGRINKKYCQLMPNWSGFGITSGSSRQPNAEYLNKIRHSFPDEFGCAHQIMQIIEQERLLTIDQYRQAFSEMPAEDKKPINLSEFLMLTGNTTGFTNRLSASGMIVTINGNKCEYDSFDTQFRNLAHLDWTIRFNPEDLTQVLAVSEQDHRFLLTEKYTQPMALRDRKPGDSDQLKQIRQFNTTVRETITEGMAEDYRRVDQLFANNPQLNNTLAKLVLIDSHGQHKDNKSAERLAPVKAQKVLAKQNKKIENEEQRSWAQQQEDYLNATVDISKYI